MTTKAAGWLQWARNFVSNSRIFRFAVVGVVNTGIYYGCYLPLLRWLKLPYLWAHLLALVISIIGSFFLNCYYTYRVRPTWGKFVKFPLSTMTNTVMTTVGVVFFVEVLKVPESIAPLVAGSCAIPATYVVTSLILHDKDQRGLTSAEEGEATAQVDIGDVCDHPASGIQATK